MESRQGLEGSLANNNVMGIKKNPKQRDHGWSLRLCNSVSREGIGQWGQGGCVSKACMGTLTSPPEPPLLLHAF